MMRMDTFTALTSARVIFLYMPACPADRNQGEKAE